MNQMLMVIFTLVHIFPRPLLQQNETVTSMTENFLQLSLLLTNSVNILEGPSTYWQVCQMGGQYVTAIFRGAAIDEKHILWGSVISVVGKSCNIWVCYSTVGSIDMYK